MSILIKGVEMPKGTNMMLLISPEGEVWEMGDLLGNDKLIAGAKAIPAADVRPVVRGKWMWFGDCSNEGLYCSVCKNKIHEARNPKKKLSNFCPNCGADMREES